MMRNSNLRKARRRARPGWALPSSQPFQFSDAAGTGDFYGVTNLTDSFVHACFGNMAEEHGQEFTNKVRFKGCSPLVRSFLSIAVSEGLRKHRQLHAGG